MNWRDANDFFAMGGYALYVWGAYGVMAVAMAVEALLVRLRHRAARAAVAEQAAALESAGRPAADPNAGASRRTVQERP